MMFDKICKAEQRITSTWSSYILPSFLPCNSGTGGGVGYNFAVAFTAGGNREAEREGA
jgi:hypothetical protein